MNILLYVVVVVFILILILNSCLFSKKNIELYNNYLISMKKTYKECKKKKLFPAHMPTSCYKKKWIF